MRLIGFAFVCWMIYQVYPHVRIDFVANQPQPLPTLISAPVIPIPAPKKPCMMRDGLMEYGVRQ